MTTPDLPPPLDPAPPTAPGPHPAGAGLVEWVRAARPAAAYLFLGLSVLFLGATIALAVRGVRATKAVEPPAAKLDDPDAPDPKPAEVADPKRGSYLIGAIAALWGFLITVGAGAFLLVGLPKPTAPEQRTEARVVLLAAGGLLGLGVFALGVAFFYLWSDSLVGWLDRGERKEMLYVVVPLLLVVAGAGLVFLAVQPARAEERHNQLLRRLVYGTNLGLTALLLVVVLVAANVVVALKFPAKLDVTEGGFYTLGGTTRAFLQTLPEPVTLYVILPDSGERVFNDVRQLAYEAQDAAGGRLKVRFISPATNDRGLTELRAKYPRVGRDELGILVTAGEDEKRNAFVPLRDLFEVEPAAPGRGGRGATKFVGEVRVMREVQFLADNEKKPVIYFTQGSKEPSVGGGPAEAADGPAATRLREFLEKSYLTVRPLTFGLGEAGVPDDAAAVVVLEPQDPLPEAAVAALTKYMTERKGKLLVAAGPAPGPDGKGAGRTGLEGLLAGFNVRLGDRFVYNYQTQDLPDYRQVLAVLNLDLRNPITEAFGEGEAYVLPPPREVAPLAAAPGFQAAPLIVTGRRTWLDDRIGPGEAIDLRQEFVTNEQLRARKALAGAGRPVAAVVSEGGSGRVVVFGFGGGFSDRAAAGTRAGSTPRLFDLFAVSLDWLRDRAPLTAGLDGKTYQEYRFPEPAAVDFTRLVLFPLGLGLLVVIGVGAGVWVIRRK